LGLLTTAPEHLITYAKIVLKIGPRFFTTTCFDKLLCLHQKLTDPQWPQFKQKAIKFDSTVSPRKRRGLVGGGIPFYISFQAPGWTKTIIKE